MTTKLNSKITLFLKDPDGIHDSIRSFAQRNLELMVSEENYREDIAEKYIYDIEDKLRKFIEYGEYMTIEIDLDTMEATVQSSKV